MTGTHTDTGPAISVRGLRKEYRAVRAVDGVDLQIDHGEVVALLGPNGAGKTTTVEILEGRSAILPAGRCMASLRRPGRCVTRRA